MKYTSQGKLELDSFDAWGFMLLHWVIWLTGIVVGIVVLYGVNSFAKVLAGSTLYPLVPATTSQPARWSTMAVSLKTVY